MGKYYSEIKGTESIRVGVGVALLNERKEVLLELRSDVEMWGLTGGKLEIGEKPEEAGCREVYEETGYRISNEDLLLFNVYGDIMEGRVIQYPEQRIHLIDIIYTAKINKEVEELLLSDETLKFEYKKAVDIEWTKVVPPARKPIRDLMKRGYVE